MNLFLYLPQDNGAGETLVALSEKVAVDGPVIPIRSFRQLASRLGQPLNDRDVVILYLPHRRHLEEMLTIASLLERVRLIVILPDPKPETIALGHKLRPRFLTTVDQHFQDVAAVLRKMGEAVRPAA